MHPQPHLPPVFVVFFFGYWLEHFLAPREADTAGCSGHPAALCQPSWTPLPLLTFIFILCTHSHQPAPSPADPSPAAHSAAWAPNKYAQHGADSAGSLAPLPDPLLRLCRLVNIIDCFVREFRLGHGRWGRSTVVVRVGACQSQYLANGLHILNIGALRATAVRHVDGAEREFK